MVVNIVYRNGTEVLKAIDADTPLLTMINTFRSSKVVAVEVISSRPVPISGVILI